MLLGPGDGRLASTFGAFEEIALSLENLVGMFMMGDSLSLDGGGTGMPCIASSCSSSATLVARILFSLLREEDVVVLSSLCRESRSCLSSLDLLHSLLFSSTSRVRSDRLLSASETRSLYRTSTLDRAWCGSFALEVRTLSSERAGDGDNVFEKASSSSAVGKRETMVTETLASRAGQADSPRMRTGASELLVPWPCLRCSDGPWWLLLATL